MKFSSKRISVYFYRKNNMGNGFFLIYLIVSAVIFFRKL